MPIWAAASSGEAPWAISSPIAAVAAQPAPAGGDQVAHAREPEVSPRAPQASPSRAISARPARDQRRLRVVAEARARRRRRPRARSRSSPPRRARRRRGRSFDVDAEGQRVDRLLQLLGEARVLARDHGRRGQALGDLLRASSGPRAPRPRALDELGEAAAALGIEALGQAEDRRRARQPRTTSANASLGTATTMQVGAGKRRRRRPSSRRCPRGRCRAGSAGCARSPRSPAPAPGRAPRA